MHLAFLVKTRDAADPFHRAAVFVLDRDRYNMDRDFLKNEIIERLLVIG